MEETNLLTVTGQVADLPLPSLAVAVIVAVPFETAVTLPLWSTVATDVLSDDQVTDLSFALLGEMVGLNVTVFPSLSVTEDQFSVMPVTNWATVISQVAVLDWSLVVTVMVAEPLPTAVTLPLASTVATDVLEDFQLTALFVASEGRIVGVKVRVFPIVLKVYWVLSSKTLVTGTTSVVNDLTSA